MNLIISERPIMIVMEYCGSCGFSTRADDLRSKLIQYYPNARFTMELIPGKTGCFEVKSRDGIIFHSKLGGDGFVEESNFQALLDRLKEKYPPS